MCQVVQAIRHRRGCIHASEIWCPGRTAKEVVADTHRRFRSVLDDDTGAVALDVKWNAGVDSFGSSRGRWCCLVGRAAAQRRSSTASSITADDTARRARCNENEVAAKTLVCEALALTQR